MASSYLTPVVKDGECRNWSELPFELMSSILCRLDLIGVFENAQKVCTSWRRVCKDPAMWRKIDMYNLGLDLGYNPEIICRHAVDRSQGGLVEINIWHFGTDSLLNYIADSSRNLRSLKFALISPITTEGLTKALVKLPLLEELELFYNRLLEDSLKAVGQSCPNLKTLKLNCLGIAPPWHVSDDDALAIAETMHGLRFLQLFANGLTDVGLKAILDNCPDLEHLDLRHCFNVHFSGDLKKRCYERIKVLRPPNDSTDDYPYIANDTSDDEDPFVPDANSDGFGTNPSTAKFLVAEGMAKRNPSSSGLAMTWHPCRDTKHICCCYRSFLFGLRDKRESLRFCEAERKIKHVILLIGWFFKFVVLLKIECSPLMQSINNNCTIQKQIALILLVRDLMFKDLADACEIKINFVVGHPTDKKSFDSIAILTKNCLFTAVIGNMFHNEVHYPEDDDPYYPEDHYFPATSERYGDDQYEIDIFGFVQI
ncbi:BnaA09g01410D [Brassica napus]|uniref:BnaA09g01410D protein n=1 Tax=Brassica napus TaxID=3708 RepID=A0A078GAQ7_BRANA|nr:BnaA09g01410D [Brassica napus]